MGIRVGFSAQGPMTVWRKPVKWPPVEVTSSRCGAEVGFWEIRNDKRACIQRSGTLPNWPIGSIVKPDLLKSSGC